MPMAGRRVSKTIMSLRFYQCGHDLGDRKTWQALSGSILFLTFIIAHKWSGFLKIALSSRGLYIKALSRQR